MPPLKPKTRTLGGVKFTCHEAGQWFSEDFRLCLSHQMPGTRLSQWTVFHTNPAIVSPTVDDFDDVNFWGYDELDYALTFGEIAKIVTKIYQRSAELVKTLKINDIVQAFGSQTKFGLIKEIKTSLDNCYADLTVELADAIENDDQWSTFDCSLAEDWVQNFQWPRKKTLAG